MDGKERTAPLFQIAFCVRCALPCMIRAQPNEAPVWGLTVLRAAQTTRGMCRECAAHWWLFSIDGIRWALSDGGPWVLEQGAIQTALSGIMAQMHPELGALDWSRLLGQWDLPWPNDWELPKDKTEQPG